MYGFNVVDRYLRFGIDAMQWHEAFGKAKEASERSFKIVF